MVIKGIDFPEQLLRAQSAGELVVFCGAGISNPPPSSLPLFAELATRIGQGSGVIKDDRDPADRYLGRLKNHGVQVHEAAARILLDGAAKPHELHRLIIKLFPVVDKLRVVTTNFDMHLSTAAKELLGEEVPIFTAPALPLGDDFSGLIYLHGCAGASPTRCIVTDEDFGRIYLTQAWASRFLAAMFSHYVVLFVGYSHDDTVMNYLARGLPPVSQRPRFAFTTEDTDSMSKWKFLGISPLIYKKCDAENSHQAITDSVREWVKEVQLGLVEKAQRVRAIAEGPPPLEGEDSDYMKFSLSHLDTSRIFFKHAKSAAWISWLERYGFIQPIFNPRSDLGEFHRELGFWLVETFLAAHSQALLAAVERNAIKLNPHFCWCIWRRLMWRKDVALPPMVFSHWTAVLLAQPYSALQPDNWWMLLNACQLPHDKPVSVLLFDRVTKPRLTMKESWVFNDELIFNQSGVDFGTNLHDHHTDEEHWANEAWTNLIQPNVASYANELEPIVVANLNAAHTMMSLSRAPNRDRDPFYVHRQSIRPHEQNHFRSAIDLLIDVGRDILDHWAKTKPERAAVQIEKWFESDVPILRRIAIYGFAIRSDVSPNEKLEWIRRNNLLYAFNNTRLSILT